MDLLHVSSVLDKARACSENEFAGRHGGTAFVIEPYERSKAHDLRSTTASIPLPSSRRPTSPFDVSARIGWIPAKQAIVRLGRDPACELVLPNARVSKRHATLQRGRHGWVLTDEHSTNGTTLDGEKLEANVAVSVADGAAIGVAEVVILRPFFAPATLHALLKGPEAPPPPERKKPTGSTTAYPELLARLASAFRALGLDAEEKDGKLIVTGLDGVSRAWLKAEPGAIAVQLERKGLGGELKSFPVDSTIEETVRAYVLSGVGFL